uniref:Uncharacterized protein n=1 Tax=Steinernema glaseri TaxID=37863 RepID=A0A1I7ZP51_9BILA
MLVNHRSGDETAISWPAKEPAAVSAGRVGDRRQCCCPAVNCPAIPTGLSWMSVVDIACLCSERSARAVSINENSGGFICQLSRRIVSRRNRAIASVICPIAIKRQSRK